MSNLNGREVPPTPSRYCCVVTPRFRGVQPAWLPRRLPPQRERLVLISMACFQLEPPRLH